MKFFRRPLITRGPLERPKVRFLALDRVVAKMHTFGYVGAQVQESEGAGAEPKVRVLVHPHHQWVERGHQEPLPDVKLYRKEKIWREKKMERQRNSDKEKVMKVRKEGREQ